MMQISENNININGTQAVTGRFTTGEKKVFVVVVLIVLVVFILARILTRMENPKVAEATNDSAESSRAVTKITFRELPNVAGRHNILHRDFFAGQAWKEFEKDPQ